ncbi:MAG: DUF1800 domain-containing protein [Bacteroidota bacterium]
MTKPMTRRGFFRFSRLTKRALDDNLPRQISPPSTVFLSGLAPYSGTWDTEQIAHLLRRTMFGAKNTDIEFFGNLTPSDAIDLLLLQPATPLPPINDYSADTNDPQVPEGETWVDASQNSNLSPVRTRSLKCWWIGNMLEQGRSLHEKMVLFWHNHIPVEFDVVRNAHYSHQYLHTLYENAFGNFKTLMKAITLDPAMLVYLNGQLNNAGAPDENYGRELQELYCIGKGPGSAYTEEDVQAAARVLTGWKIAAGSTEAYFAPGAHDTNEKVFSSFYGKAVIEGKQGDEGAEELDELLDMIFDHPETAKHICRKLYTFFVYQNIDDEIEQAIIEPLAQLLRDNDYEIRPVLETLLKSEHFFDPWFRGSMLKSPLEQVIGMAREMHVVFPNPLDFQANYEVRKELHSYLPDLLQDPGDPYDVAGWPAWYQVPVFYKWWVTVATLPRRARHTDMMLTTGYSSGNFQVKLDVVRYTETLADPADPEGLVDEVIRLFYGIEVADVVKDQLKSILLSGQANDYYWTDAWYEYQNAPGDPTAYNVVQTRLQTFYQSILQLEEYQLL